MDDFPNVDNILRVSNKVDEESNNDFGFRDIILKRTFINKLLMACILTSGIFISLLGISIKPALADFRICNDTKSLVGAALGYRQEGKWISEGWFQIPAESCNSLIEGDLSSRFYYIYAEDADSGGQWRGDVFLCTKEKEFKIDGIADCFKRGFVKTGFFEIDTGNRVNWMVRLTEQSQSNQAN